MEKKALHDQYTCVVCIVCIPVGTLRTWYFTLLKGHKLRTLLMCAPVRHACMLTEKLTSVAPKSLQASSTYARAPKMYIYPHIKSDSDATTCMRIVYLINGVCREWFYCSRGTCIGQKRLWCTPSRRLVFSCSALKKDNNTMSYLENIMRHLKQRVTV